MSDEDRGLYQKFIVDHSDQLGNAVVRRTDGSKHDGCFYFVLDLDHDPHARPALLAYAASCRETHPELAFDLERIARSL